MKHLMKVKEIHEKILNCQDLESNYYLSKAIVEIAEMDKIEECYLGPLKLVINGIESNMCVYIKLVDAIECVIFAYEINGFS